MEELGGGSFNPTASDAGDRRIRSPRCDLFLRQISDGRVPIARVYALDEIVEAHRDMEAGVGSGKRVVLTH
jgi:hypothetical protein